MTETALFVGGPWDGRRQAIEHKTPQIKVAVLQQPPIHAYNEPISSIDCTSNTCTYNRMAFFGQVFYVFERSYYEPYEYDAPHISLLKKLIAGYRVPVPA